MKKIPLATLAVALVCGCASTKSPYDRIDSWLIREDAVRPFFVDADIIYVQDGLYVDMGNVSGMTAYAKDAVGNGRFAGVARVFSPLVADANDMKLAIKWYFDHHHEGTRPFLFIGEGEGGALLKAYEEQNAEKLAKKGFIAGYYAETAHPGFVNNEMLRDIKNGIARAKYREKWGREMPEGMLEK